MDQPETDDEGGRIVRQMHLLVRAGEASDSERDMRNDRWITKRDWQVVPSFEKFEPIFTARKRTIPVVTSRAHLEVDMYYETVTKRHGLHQDKHFEALNRCEGIREADGEVVMEYIGARLCRGTMQDALNHMASRRRPNGVEDAPSFAAGPRLSKSIRCSRASVMSKFRVHYSQALAITLYSRDYGVILTRNHQLNCSPSTAVLFPKKRHIYDLPGPAQHTYNVLPRPELHGINDLTGTIHQMLLSCMKPIDDAEESQTVTKMIFDNLVQRNGYRYKTKCD
ncbi:hypothetical protein C8R48DRAFT_669966 [Suillus tomentosus]|nr:hypothetical protein C8R48DRAFT_669966 [Suillus tomentosus]